MSGVKKCVIYSTTCTFLLIYVPVPTLYGFQMIPIAYKYMHIHLSNSFCVGESAACSGQFSYDVCLLYLHVPVFYWLQAVLPSFGSQAVLKWQVFWFGDLLTTLSLANLGLTGARGNSQWEGQREREREQGLEHMLGS